MKQHKNKLLDENTVIIDPNEVEVDYIYGLVATNLYHNSRYQEDEDAVSELSIKNNNSNLNKILSFICPLDINCATIDVDDIDYVGVGSLVRNNGNVLQNSLCQDNNIWLGKDITFSNLSIDDSSSDNYSYHCHICNQPNYSYLSQNHIVDDEKNDDDRKKDMSFSMLMISRKRKKLVSNNEDDLDVESSVLDMMTLSSFKNNYRKGHECNHSISKLYEKDINEFAITFGLLNEHEMYCENDDVDDDNDTYAHDDSSLSLEDNNVNSAIET